MNTKIKTKQGNISAYGFMCGYIEKVEKDTLHKEIYREHGVYTVRSTKNNTPALNTQFDGRTSHAFLIWENFPCVKDARTFYNKIK